MKNDAEIARLVLGFLGPDIESNVPIIDPLSIARRFADTLDPSGESPPAVMDGLLTYIRDQVIRVIRDPKTFEDMNVPNLLQPYYPLEDESGWWKRLDCIELEHAEKWSSARSKAAHTTMIKAYALEAHVRSATVQVD